TGRRAFPARTRDELARLYAEHTPVPVADLVPGIDPRVDRAIRHCLEPEPTSRPASARAVAALLPKLDPLVTALAEGQMPSPEMVANAGAEGILSPQLAAGLLAAAVLGVLLIAFLSRWASVYGRVPIDRPPEALTARA